MDYYLPAAFVKYIEDDTLKIWRRPNIFTLAGVEKARIIWRHASHIECRGVDKIADDTQAKAFRDFVLKLSSECRVPVYGI